MRSGGTALIPVKRASDCVAMKLSPEDVIPADKLGTCKSQALPVCNPDVNHEYKVDPSIRDSVGLSLGKLIIFLCSPILVYLSIVRVVFACS